MHHADTWTRPRGLLSGPSTSLFWNLPECRATIDLKTTDFISFEENIMDGPKQRIIVRNHGNARPANNPDRSQGWLPRWEILCINFIYSPLQHSMVEVN